MKRLWFALPTTDVTSHLTFFSEPQAAIFVPHTDRLIREDGAILGLLRKRVCGPHDTAFRGVLLLPADFLFSREFNLFRTK